MAKFKSSDIIHENVGGLLSLIDVDQKAVFGKAEKCKVLQDVFFWEKVPWVGRIWWQTER